MIERLSTTFATTRLTVRLIESRDLEGLQPVFMDDEVTRYLPYATWQTPDDGAAWLARIASLQEEGRLRQFVVIDSAEQRPVGSIVLFNVDATHSRGEVGYLLGRRDWGRGLMREALTAFVTHAFDDLALRRIEASIDPRNLASHRLITALGFTHEGVLRERSFIKGQVVDSNAYGLLAGEWRGRSLR